MPRTAILYIEERCNQSCVFCLEEDGNWTEFVAPDTAKVCETINAVHARGADQITFMGGETFFRKDLPEILRHARSIGMQRLGVTTNGTVLSKPGFIQNLAESGLDCVEISVHGHTPELSLAISRNPVTFARQAAAMAEINATGCLTTIVNVVVCAENAGSLREVAAYVLDAMPDIPVRFKFKFVSLQGWAAGKADTHGRALSYEDVDFVALGDFLAERGAKFWFYNVPLCRLGRHAERSHEVATQVGDEQYFDRDHKGSGEYYDSGHQLEGRIWPKESCASCTLRALCPGIEETHRLANGSRALSPMASPPLPIVRFALSDMGFDPANAEAELARLMEQPRPGSFVRPRPDGAVRFVHPEYEQPLDLMVAAASPGSKHYFATPHFELSYRSSLNLGEHPEVNRLLERAKAALERMENRCGTLDDVRLAVAECADAPWSLDAQTDLPARSLKKNQLRLFKNVRDTKLRRNDDAGR
jgi:hypothetical protein